MTTQRWFSDRLLQLSEPWCATAHLGGALRTLPVEERTVASAIEALDVYLDAWQVLPDVQPETFSSELQKYWGMEASLISSRLPTFGDISVERFRETLRELQWEPDWAERLAPQWLAEILNGNIAAIHSWIPRPNRFQASHGLRERTREILRKRWSLSGQHLEVLLGITARLLPNTDVLAEFAAIAAAVEPNSEAADSVDRYTRMVRGQLPQSG